MTHLDTIRKRFNNSWPKMSDMNLGVAAIHMLLVILAKLPMFYSKFSFLVDSMNDCIGMMPEQ